MLRKIIPIFILFLIHVNTFSYSVDSEFFSLERKMKGVKKITEKHHRNWKTVSYFNKDGFLLRKVNYYKNRIKSDYRYEYIISDTLLEIKSRECLNTDNSIGKYLVKKYYYNHLKQCYKFEYYSPGESLEKPFVVGNNFIYKDNRLESYERSKDIDSSYKKFIDWMLENDTAYKKRYETIGVNPIAPYYTCYAPFERIVYVYGKNLQTELYYDICKDTTLLTIKRNIVFQEGKQIDEIYENGEGRDVFLISGEKIPNTHIKYSNFDRHGNWKKSYSVREKRERIRSRRRIEYW